MTTENPKKVSAVKYQTPEKIALNELRRMLAVFIVGNAVAVAACVVYGLVVSPGLGNWRFYLQVLGGAAVGNIAAVANFYLIGVGAGKAIRSKNAKAARRMAFRGYLLRYGVGFVCFGALLYFRLINPVTAFVPLFFPKIYYTLSVFRKN